MFYWAFRAGHFDKEWATVPTASDRPRTPPAGTLRVPLSAPSACRVDPLWGRCPPCLRHRLPLSGFAGKGLFLKRASAQARRAEVQRVSDGRFACKLSGATRNRPGGGVPATEYGGRACTVESPPCPARRRRDRRALLSRSAIALLPAAPLVKALLLGGQAGMNRGFSSNLTRSEQSTAHFQKMRASPVLVPAHAQEPVSRALQGIRMLP